MKTLENIRTPGETFGNKHMKTFENIRATGKTYHNVWKHMKG